MKPATAHTSSLDTCMKSIKSEVDKELLRILTKKLQPTKIPPNGFEGSTLHAVLIGGKRLRPMLVVAAYEMCGKKRTPTIIRASCSLELIHAGSLMLDDLPCMDNADYRRGEPTTHKVFGEATTILASASLWVAAFELLSELTHPAAQDLIHDTSTAMGSRGLVQGQLLDLAAFNKTQDIDDLEECYRLKTGVLFALATKMGAVLADASPAQQKAMHRCGELLGIAFQIRDDIIDATQTVEQSGKDTQLDEKNNKPTYVSILGLKGAEAELQNTVHKAHRALRTHKIEPGILDDLADSLLTY